MRDTGLNSNAAEFSIAALTATLSDLIDLAAAVKQAHWTVKGPNFIAVHQMLDDLRGRIDDHADTVAERIVALRGAPKGTVQAVASGSRLAPYDLGLTRIDDHLAALAERVAQITASTRVEIDRTGEAGDQVTADIFTEVTRALDKDLWFIEAHLQP